MADEPGLNVLLAKCLLSLTREYERTDGRAPTLPLYANLLRILDDDGRDIREIASRARISKRAARTLLNATRRTGAGATERAGAARTLTAAETAWTARVGPGSVAQLRAALEGLVGELDLEHPHYLMQYGTADPSAIGGKWPGHGQDWKPVPRLEPLGSLPLTALLSQALMDFTIRYEAGPTWPLSTTVHSLLKFPDEGLPLAAAPTAYPVTGNGRSLFERHGVVEVRDGTATLTARGRSCRDAYEPNVARVEGEWCDRYGDGAVAALRAALSEAGDRLEPGLADHPLLDWTGKGCREASGERRDALPPPGRQ
ncbi:MAG TPA: hypothetical protein VKV06_10705 [Acidimicrobiales bacterium]|nr:hypothetical protein [Acidimicrobiales bacterium]